MYIIHVSFILRDEESSVLTKTQEWQARSSATSDEIYADVYAYATVAYPEALYVSALITDATESIVL